MKESIYRIGELHNLRLIETTTGRNGYPRECKHALIGFDNFEEAERVAELYNLRITTFFKRDGWQLWERNSNTTYEPMRITSEDYGDNYRHFQGEDVQGFYANEVKPFLSVFEDFYELENFLDNERDIIEHIERAGDDQLVITYCGDYYDTIDEVSMRWSFDTKNYAIGVIDDCE